VVATSQSSETSPGRLGVPGVDAARVAGGFALNVLGLEVLVCWVGLPWLADVRRAFGLITTD